MKAQSQYNKKRIQNKKKKHGNGIFITKKRKNKSQDGNLIPIFLKIIFV